MQLFIFNSLEKIQAVLKDNIKDPVWLEKVNGENTFDFSFPADDSKASYLSEGNLVAFKDDDGNFQLFEISKVNEVHSSNGILKTCHCENAFYELIDDWIEDKRPSSCTAEYALGQILADTRWSVGTVDVVGSDSITFYQQNIMKSLHDIVEKWGGEIRTRVVISGSSITNRYIDLFTTRGTITKKRFEYKHDLKDIQREVDLTNVKTALYGFGRGEEQDTGGFGRRTNFNDIVWTKPPNDADKPAAQKWVEDPDAKVLWGRPEGGNPRNRFGDFIVDDETDPATLLQKTWDKLQTRNTPRISYALSVVDLEQLSGYDHEAVRLGDTVVVIDREFATAIEVSARVVELQKHLTDPTQTKVVLGNFFPDASDYFSQLKNLETTYTDWECLARATFKSTWLDGIINVLDNEIKTNDGRVTYTDNNGILIENADQTKALKLLGGILALSNEKVLGEYQWRTFATGDGFVCDELLAGTITAQEINLKTDGATQSIIKSDNFVAGSAGWCIKSDGTCEFSSGTFRGSLSGATGTFAGNLSASECTAYQIIATTLWGDNCWPKTPGYGTVGSSTREWFSVFAAYGQFSDKIISTGDGIYNQYNSAARWKHDDANYMMQSTTKIQMIFGGVVKHQFNSDGTKVGGTIETKSFGNLGMSPVDSPLFLITDVLKVDVEKERKIKLNKMYLETIEKDTLNIFLTNIGNSDVKLKKITKNGFILIGNGQVSCLITAIRKGCKNKYFLALDKKEESKCQKKKA